MMISHLLYSPLTSQIQTGRPGLLLPILVCLCSFTVTTKAVVEETSKLADCIGKNRTLLRKILSEGVDHCIIKLDNDPQGYLTQPLNLLEAVLQECHNTFTACFHSFYPTPALQWACLCDLLNCLDQVLKGVWRWGGRASLFRSDTVLLCISFQWSCADVTVATYECTSGGISVMLA